MSCTIDYKDDGTEIRTYHCIHCQEFLRREKEMILLYPFGTPGFEKVWRMLYDFLYTNCEKFKVCKRPRIGNQHPKGAFAGTLTLSSKDPYNEEDMIHAIKKIFSQKTSPVKRYVWYLEYQKSGAPHIHFIYETVSGGRILRQVFSRYWKIWDEDYKMGDGFRGGYHKPVAHEDEYLDYIKKCNGRHVNNWTA